jgi:hypothetical protein
MKKARVYLFALLAVSAVPAINHGIAQQQPGQQVSEARRATIQKCIQQAHQEDPSASSSTIQQRYIVYVNCMTAAGMQP